MSKRIRVERALTLSDPGVGWVVIAGDQGGYFTTWQEAIAHAFRIADREARREAPDLGIACRALMHELCQAEWCICDCHEQEVAA
jgi:hypothetical protein